ncbi:tetratricopeptide repeat protein [Pyxidicoccus sp. 3LG]
MGLDLKLRVTESGGTRGPQGPAAPEQTYVMPVRLRREWIRHGAHQGNDVVLDFPGRRRLELDEDARTYTETSLYASLGNRHFELPNREHIRSVIAAGGGDASDFEPVIAEHQLAVLDKARNRTIAGAKSSRGSGLGGRLRSMFSKPERSDISVESEQGYTVYVTDTGRRLLSYSDDGVDAEPDRVRQFVRFLRYRFNGHPLILERIASAGRIPRELRYWARQPIGFLLSNVTLRVEAMETVPDDALRLDGLRRVLAPTETPQLDSVLERVLLGDVPDSQEVAARRKQEAREAVDADRMFESVLALLSLTLETDVALPGLGDALQSLDEPHVQRMRDALTTQPGSKEEARAVAETYVELQQAAGRWAYVLKTFEAASRRALGEKEKARDLLLAALQANPFLTGAYKDLGDLYLQGFQMHVAWMCWEAARKISPGHRLMKDIDELEAMLAAEHPEYL